MGNACGCNENRDQLGQGTQEAARKAEVEKEFEEEEKLEDHHPSESFAQVNTEKVGNQLNTVTTQLRQELGEFIYEHEEYENSECVYLEEEYIVASNGSAY